MSSRKTVLIMELKHMANKSKPEWLKGVVNGAPTATGDNEADSSKPVLLNWHFDNDGTGLKQISPDGPPPEIPPTINVFVHASANFHDVVRALHQVIDDLNELPF